MIPVTLPPDASARVLSGVVPAALPLVLEALVQELEGPPCSVAFLREGRSLEGFAAQIEAVTQVLRSGSKPVELLLLPDPPATGEDAPPNAFEQACDRLAALTRLAAFTGEGGRLLVLTTPKAFFQPVPPPGELQSRELRLRPGMPCAFAELCRRLGEELDYDHEVVCELPGQYAVRGGLVDIYPFNASAPLRLDFFGDEIESIRSYDPTTQRSLDPIAEAVIAARPHEDGATESVRHLFGYLRTPVRWIYQEPDALAEEAPLLFERFERLATPRLGLGDLYAARTGLGDQHLGLVELENTPTLFGSTAVEPPLPLTSLEPYREQAPEEALGMDRVQAEESARRAFLALLRSWERAGEVVCFVLPHASEAERLRELLESDPATRGWRPEIRRGVLAHGFRLAGPVSGLSLARSPAADPRRPLAVVTDTEVFGRFRLRPPARRRRLLPHKSQVDHLLDFSELVEGDYLVHLAHGICIYRGLSKMELRGRLEEVISLEFDASLTLHVPLHESHLLTRYVGLSKLSPKLGRPGSGNWERARRAAEAATLDFAAELLQLQARREQGGGFACLPDTVWQKQFEEAFAFEPTPDQRRAIDETKADQERTIPMDRLICGDVGFGKTEVAIRAAFKAVMSGKQVAILVPTTVLAQQHYNTFRERMAGYPATVEMLSRFRNPAQQREILRQLAEGRIDILVGTHRLLGADVVYRDLGLVVIDEEHRFGVRHKERLKRLKAEVDVLTMSATPIPRTLHLALVGARALSVIETAPTNRLPIQTLVKTYEPELVKNAIAHELGRGGQVFYLHNRVQTIESVAERIREWLPKARVAVGHGQMSEDTLERIMTRFVAGDYDVLVCTTIIENGLDIPNCNTILIEGADRFGLAQLYQLRGRVGRFNRQAYAYLLLHRHARMLEQARQRLSALRQHNQLGAGFKIAMRDLELRGAGNLLGAQQSGHIASVGFDLYCQLLRQSIARLKGDPLAARVRAVVKLDCVVLGEGTGDGPARPESGFHVLRADELEGTHTAPIQAYLPADWLTETRLRIDIYRRLAMAETTEVVNAIEAELKDRFGKPPKPVEALLRVTRIRTLAESVGLGSVEVEGNLLKCRRAQGARGEYVKLGERFPRLTAAKAVPRLREIEQFLRNLT